MCGPVIHLLAWPLEVLTYGGVKHKYNRLNDQAENGKRKSYTLRNAAKVLYISTVEV